MQPVIVKIKFILSIFLLTALAGAGLWLTHPQPPVLKKHLHTDFLGDVPLYQPLWGAKTITLLFLDTRQYQPDSLGEQLAVSGSTAIAIIDATTFLSAMLNEAEHCLSGEKLHNLINSLTAAHAGQHIIVAGLGDGALIPLLNARTDTLPGVSNISIGYSLKSPALQQLCPPATSDTQAATASPWLSIWADEPDAETALFVRKMPNATTRIAAYDTPIATLLENELKALADPSSQSVPPMPVVENNSATHSDTLTIFYSGDGGWRDLDRSVAGIMVERQYPVVGVDVLRYFWEHKSPEQAAADLATTMAYYRRNWGVKSFVLAGYSFGADILPVLYNRLDKADQDSVSLLVLLALGEKADFEIHVSGWLGKNSEGMALTPELASLPKAKILCVYGREEQAETACSTLQNSQSDILELPGGHHFDQDYPALTQKILDVYTRHGIER